MIIEIFMCSSQILDRVKLWRNEKTYPSFLTLDVRPPRAVFPSDSFNFSTPTLHTPYSIHRLLSLVQVPVVILEGNLRVWRNGFVAIFIDETDCTARGYETIFVPIKDF